MSNETSNSSSKRINVLTLDGGGIRGLSSLLILKDLMVHVNKSIAMQNPQEAAHDEVQPHHIFNLAAGTSTGGLIAIMLGKLGMTVDECIEAYEQLASHIFGKKRLRARFTGGLAPAKYSGSGMMRHVRTLLQKKDFPENLTMYSPDAAQDKIACAVICREHENESRYSNFLPDAVCICSLECLDQIDCQVCEAARATSAAPTFFSVQTIGKKHFVDGGMEFNNPTYEIWSHYSQYISIAESRRRSTATEIESQGHPGGLDLSEVRFINLGTGDQPKAPDQRNRDNKLSKLIPAPIRMGLSLKKKLTEIAVNSERVAANMQGLAHVASGRFRIEYARFSADNGVCFIKMDRYKKISDIRRLTLEYLATEKIQHRLRRLGNDIANDYLAKQSARVVQRAHDRLSVPQYSLERPQWQESAPSPDTEPSIDMSRNANSSIESTPSRHSAMNITSPESNLIFTSSPPQKTLHVAEAEEVSIVQ